MTSTTAQTHSTTNHTHLPSRVHSQTHARLPTCPPSTPTPHTQTAWHLSQVGGGVTRTHAHAHMQTQTHPDTQTQSCCLQWAYPFDPLTGTRRISKWEEKPQSRSTSQRRALSIGSCRTPRGSRGRRCLSQEAKTLLSGSEVCLERYLHLSGREAGGQEVRQEWDHLYHVLCMTCGMCLNIYMCLKVMQIEREKEGGSWENCVSFVNKACV